MSITSTDPAPDQSRDELAPETENRLSAERSALSTTKSKVAAGFLAVALLVTGGFALTHLGGPATSASNVAAGGPGGGGPGGAANGSFTPPGQGTIAAVSASSITVKTSNGTQTYKVTSATEIQNNGATARTTSLTVGERVVVFAGTPPNSAATVSADTANRIMAGSSATARPSGAGLPGAQTGAVPSASSGTTALPAG